MADTTTEVSSSSWDEERCKAALAQLERLQSQASAPARCSESAPLTRAQLDDLRMTIPRVVDPFNSHLTSGPVIYKQFSSAAIGSQNNIKAIRAQWQSPDTQTILEHAKQSLEKNDDLSAGAQVARFGWVHAEIVEREKANRSKRDKKDTTDDKLDKEEIGKMLDTFKTANPKIKVEAKDDNRDIQLSFLADGIKHNFHVTIEEADGRRRVNAECVGTASPYPSISRSIASREQPNDFKYLLDMIAAYKDVRASTCAKCSKLLDRTATMPTARRTKSTPNNKDPVRTEWDALHERCLA